MSDPLRIALIAEGPTDAIIIEAALKALLPKQFILTLLQPEPTQPRLGTGWGGVLRWCDTFASKGISQLEVDSALPGYDIFILHIDSDVTEKSYRDVSSEYEHHSLEKPWPPLPSPSPCPPASRSSDHMRHCLLSWCGLSCFGPRTVLCVPSKAIDAWLTAARFMQGHKLLDNLECNLRLEAQLNGLPKADRIKKTQRDYRTLQKTITSNWSEVRRLCPQAERFSKELAFVIS